MGLLSLIGGLPGLISGFFGTINSITSAIANEKLAQIGATTERERIASGERISQLQQQRDVLIADAAHGSWDIWVRTIIAAGPASVLLKLFLWDKVVGSLSGCAGEAGRAAACAWFMTDPLDINLWNVIMVVLGFYFLSATSTTIAKIIAARK